MKTYAKLKRETVQSSYREATEEAQRSGKEEPSREVSLEEFALKNAAETVKPTSCARNRSLRLCRLRRNGRAEDLIA